MAGFPLRRQLAIFAAVLVLGLARHFGNEDDDENRPSAQSFLTCRAIQPLVCAMPFNTSGTAGRTPGFLSPSVVAQASRL